MKKTKTKDEAVEAKKEKKETEISETNSVTEMQETLRTEAELKDNIV